MFNKLKDKLKSTIASFGSEISKEDEIDESEPFEEENQKEETDLDEQKSDELEKEEVLEEKNSTEKKPKTTFKEKLTTAKLDEDKFEEIFFELEMELLQSNVAQEAVETIKSSLNESLVGQRFPRGKINNKIKEALKEAIYEILPETPEDLISISNRQKPYIIAALGTNGAGKTTTIAKLANYFQKNKKSVVVAAADTFRAGAIDQIEKHSNNLDFTLIKHEYKSDPSAVAYDAIAHAKSKDKDIVIIDTAGRLHTNDNLMQELAKIIKVSKPHLKLFIGESTTGNDCIEQAKTYKEKVGIDAITLTKTDSDESGGAALSISHACKVPIYFYGNGQSYEDLEKYDKEKTIEKLGLENDNS